MKLALFLNIRFYYDGKSYTADEAYFLFWSSFASYFEKVILCVPVKETRSYKGKFEVDLSDGNVDICHLPFYEDSLELYKKAFLIISRAREIIIERIEDWDIIGAVVPNIMGLYILKVAARFSMPRFAYIRGNNLRTVKHEYDGPKKWLACPVALLMELVLRRLTARTLTFTVGGELWARYKGRDNPVHKIVVSLVRLADVKDRVTVRPGTLGKINILHVGRLSSERGMVYLIEGVDILRRRYGRDFALTIVGSGPEEGRLKERVVALGLEDRVRFTGYLPYGDKVVRLYRDSDVFVLPSLTEGVPKVVLETLANGVPLVATSVGGIPEIISDGVNGLMLPPADPSAIAHAVYRLSNDENLRAALAGKGLETVKDYTLERQRENIVRILRSHYRLQFDGKET